MKRTSKAYLWRVAALIVGLILLAGAVPAYSADPTTVASSTMVFEGTLTDNGDGTYSGILPMVDEGTVGGGDGVGGYDVYGDEGATAWFGAAGPTWTSVTITNHDAWPAWDPDTPDWYQYSLNLYVDSGQNRWAVRNHPGATAANPWYDTAFWGSPKPAAGVPMSGAMYWGTSYAEETDTGAYLPGTGTPLIAGGAASKGGGPRAWDMDWSWGSEVVPLEYPGFDVAVQDLGSGTYRVTLTPAAGPVVNTTTGQSYGTIQAAVNDASSGNTITVAAGTYKENVVLNKSLTLSGAQASMDACGRVTGSPDPAVESIITASSGILLELKSGSAASVIDGFAFVGGANGIRSNGGPLNDLVIRNNHFEQTSSSAVFLNDSGVDITVHQNSIDGSSAGSGGIFHLDTDNFDGFQFTSNCVSNGDTGFFVDGNRNVGTSAARDPLFSDNLFKDNGAGMNVGKRALENAEVSYNTFESNDYDGLQGGPKDTVITENRFVDNDRFGLAFTSFGDSDPAKGAQGCTVTYNSFSGNTSADVFFSSGQASGTISTNALNYNQLLSSVGVSYGGTEVIDAEYNWWGDATGPVHGNNPHGGGAGGSAISGSADFIPWYATSTTTPTTENVSVTHNPLIAKSDTIKGGVDAAVAGASPKDTIDVSAGIYNENVVIDKGLTLQSVAGAASTTISASGGTAVTVAADDVDIDGFTITNPTGTAGVYAEDHSDITIKKNIVTSVGNSSPNTSAQGIYIKSNAADVANIEITDNQISAIHAGTNKSAKGILIGDTPGTYSITGLLIEGNAISNVTSDTSAWPVGHGAYGILLGHGTAGGDTSGAQILDNIITNLEGLWAHGIGLEADTPNALVQRNDISYLTDHKSPTDAVAIQVEDNPSADTINVDQNCFSNVNIGVQNVVSGKTVDADHNWWGATSGPTHLTKNPGGTGAAVSDDVDFEPWINDMCGGSSTSGNWQNQTTLAYDDLQGSLDAANTGDVIKFVGTGPIAGGATTGSAPGVTIDLNGGTFGPSSPWLTVSTADYVVLGPGTLDGWTGTANSSDPAILVTTGGDNFTLKDAEVLRWADGVEVDDDVTSFKLVSNWIHDNTDAGLQIDAGVSLDAGVVTIEGNLFKVNGGNGIQNGGTTTDLKAQYNSWGDIDGADTGTGGDGIGGSVDASNPTFSEVWMDMEPDLEATSRTVVEDDVFNVAVKVDAAGLYAVQYRVTYDEDLLTLQLPVTEGPFKGTGTCLVDTGTAGVVEMFCTRFEPDGDVGATAGGETSTVATLSFKADLPGIGVDVDGPWTNYFDISTEAADLSSGARGGVKVYVNNGGFGAYSGLTGREITDSNDGEIHINGLANYTGFVDLQGRPNDSGAWVNVYNQQATSGSILLAKDDSASSGSYTTVYETGYQLVVGQTYWLQVDRPLYLPTTVKFGGLATNYAHSKLLSTRPLTTLNNLKLLGGDADDNDKVEVLDAICIGVQYGSSTPGPCSGSGSADVNGDTVVNLLDLVLMGSNYDLTSSSWTP